MKNKLIGLLIVALYLSNGYICNFFFANNTNKLWDLYVAILSICMILAIKYKESSNFIEKLFVSMVLNNCYVLIVKQEFQYTLNDVWFVGLFTLAQYTRRENKKE